MSPGAVALTVLLAGLLDVSCGEPPNAVHPVAWLGSLIALLDRHAPHERPRAELAYGVGMVAGRLSAWPPRRGSRCASRWRACPGGSACPSPRSP